METTAKKNINDRQQKVLRVLMAETDASRPMSAANVAKAAAFGYFSKEKRNEDGWVKAAVHELQIMGFPICSTPHGYFHAKSNTDVEKFLRKLQGRIDNEQKVIDGLKRSITGETKISETGEVSYTKQVALRTPEGTVTYIRVTILPDGTTDKFIIPTGHTLI